jgi:hypothetical protein
MEARKASGCLGLGREVIEERSGAFSGSWPLYSRTLDQSNRYCDHSDRLKAMNRSACRYVRKSVGFARRGIRCCFVRPRVLANEGNVADGDGPVLVVNRQRSGDNSPSVLCIPWSSEWTVSQDQIIGRLFGSRVAGSGDGKDNGRTRPGRSRTSRVSNLQARYGRLSRKLAV